MVGVFFLFLAVFLYNGAADPANILLFVSVGHVVENARLVDVDGGAPGVCVQADSFVVVYGRSFSHQIHQRGDKAVGETGGRRGSRVYNHAQIFYFFFLRF